MSDPIVPPPRLPHGVNAVMPAHARHGYLPARDSMLTITLGGDRLPNGQLTGGESVRGRVETILSKDVLTVRVEGIITRTAEHGFRSGDLVPIRRGLSGLGTEIWIPVDDTELREQEARQRAQLAADRIRNRAAEEAAAAAQQATELEENL